MSLADLIDRVHSLRRHYWSNHYRPIEVWNPEQIVSDTGEALKAPGKQPRGRWREAARRDPPDAARMRPDPRALNTGISCEGEVIGVDVDILELGLVDPVVAAAEQCFGITPLVRNGLAPKTLLVYRPVAAFGKIQTPELFLPDGRKCKVELLAAGQQFVGDGIHPDTRKPYRWIGETPETVPLGELPEVSEAEARAFIGDAEALLLAAGARQKDKPGPKGDRRQSSSTSGEGDDDAFFRAVNRAALANLEAWVRELFPQAVFQQRTGAWRVSSANLGRDLQEDLSIHPDGIEDFGTERKLSPIWLVQEHRHDVARPIEAALWLCERLRLDPAGLGDARPQPKVKRPEPPEPPPPIVEDLVEPGAVPNAGGDGALTPPPSGGDGEQQARPPGQSELGAMIDQLNRRFALVNEAGKAIIYQPAFDPMLRRQILWRLRVADFKTMFSNRRLSIIMQGAVGPHLVTKTWAEWWLRDLRRRQFLGGVVCDPSNRAPKTCWNLYTGLSISPAPGAWHLMREHIEKVICSSIPEWSNYLLDTLARMFQHPDVPGEVAVVLRGKKGSGKGIVFNHLKRAWGQHGIHIANPSHLTGNFNAHLRDCIMLFADEAFVANDRRHESVLKALITEPTIPIEGKYQNVVEVVNLLHVFLASNADWVIPASVDERRFFVLDVLDTRIGDHEYFAALAREMEEGGLSAMIYDLLQRDISNFAVRDVPQTAALQAQKTLSMTSLEQWWLTVLTRGYLWRSRHGAPWFTSWHPFYTIELLGNSYLQWCSENRPRDRKNREQLKDFFDQVYAANRPRGEHPVHETDSIDRHAVDVITNPNGSVITVPKPLDDIAIILKDRPRGYHVGELVEARVRFTEMRDVDTPWGLDPDE